MEAFETLALGMFDDQVQTLRMSQMQRYLCCCAQEEGSGLEEQQATERALSLQRRRSIPLLLHYAPLDLMEALSEGGAFNGDHVLLLGAHQSWVLFQTPGVWCRL